MTAQKAQTTLDQWDLTKAWLKYTYRTNLGNILGAPEPRDTAHFVDVTLQAAGYADAIGEFLNQNSPLKGFLTEFS